MKFSDTLIALNCEICGNEVKRTRKSYRASLRKGYRITCSKVCGNKCKSLPKKEKIKVNPRVIVNDGRLVPIIDWPHTKRNTNSAPVAQLAEASALEAEGNNKCAN